VSDLGAFETAIGGAVGSLFLGECEIFSRHAAGQSPLRPEQAGLPAEPAGSVCIGSARLGAMASSPSRRQEEACCHGDGSTQTGESVQGVWIDQGVEVNLARA
jgi:hypothetical protein